MILHYQVLKFLRWATTHRYWSKNWSVKNYAEVEGVSGHCSPLFCRDQNYLRVESVQDSRQPSQEWTSLQAHREMETPKSESSVLFRGVRPDPSQVSKFMTAEPPFLPKFKSWQRLFLVSMHKTLEQSEVVLFFPPTSLEIYLQSVR